MQRDLLLYGGSMREGLEFFLIYTHTGSEKRSASHFLCVYKVVHHSQVLGRDFSTCYVSLQTEKGLLCSCLLRDVHNILVETLYILS